MTAPRQPIPAGPALRRRLLVGGGYPPDGPASVEVEQTGARYPFAVVAATRTGGRTAERGRGPAPGVERMAVAELAAALRAGCAGDRQRLAAIDLLVADGTWLSRTAFRRVVDLDGEAATVRWSRLVDDPSVFEASDQELTVLYVAMMLHAKHPTLHHLDPDHAALVATAVAAACGAT